MPKSVQLSAYGGIEQLRIVDVPKPVPQAGEVLVRVVAAGTNPGEIAIREGLLRDMFPMDFPFGQGTDFAGRIDSVGPGVTGLATGGRRARLVGTTLGAGRIRRDRPRRT